MKRLTLALAICAVCALFTVGCGNQFSLDRFQGESAHFALDDYRLDSTNQAVVDYKVDYLKHFTGEKVMLAGNTDDRDTDRYNLGLGRLRAEEVQKYMVHQGIDARRIQMLTDGKRLPVQPGTSEPARTSNRRVDFYLISKDSPYY